MRQLFIFLLLALALPAQSEMVDTFQFHNAEERTRAMELAKSLRCPQCQNQNLVESNSPIAYDLRIEVYNMVNQGKSNQQIIDNMTARFGNFVLYKPPFQWTTALLWLGPIVLLAIALGLMWHYLRGREKLRQKSPPLDNQTSAQLQQLLAKSPNKQGE